MKVVYLDDAKIKYEEAVSYFEQAGDWARQQCPSFINFYIQDVSDVSLICDHVTAYHFKDPKDAVWFELKWK